MTRISFFPFGTIDQASARLRAYRLASALRAQGHEVDTEGHADAEIVVLQKKRNFDALYDAKRAGARVVYDFDDHHLLAESGARDDTLKVLSLADVVTVGSPELLDASRPYHPNVRLFENPIDVLPGSRPKEDYAWRGRLGWFGNRSNLVALDALALDRAVTTITAHGDIEWALETVDAHLASMDLVLLPVERSAWTLAKNANRLLKCATLRVPFLASDTPEHRRAIELLGLPEWMLVRDRDGWPDAIRTVEARYGALVELLQSASERALDAFGLERQASRWLEAVRDPARPGATTSEAARRLGASLDILVLAERTPERIAATVASARALGCDVASIEVISAPPAGDFFDIHPALAARIASSASGPALIVQAGVELRPALLETLASMSGTTERVVLVRPQIGVAGDPSAQPKPGVQVNDVPRDVADLVSEPALPLALLVPPRERREGSVEAAAGPLWAWDLLLRHADEARPWTVLDVPVSLVAPETLHATPIDGHRAHLEATAPEIAAELRPASIEWPRMRTELVRAIAERRRGLFERWSVVLAARARWAAGARGPKDGAADELAAARKQLAKLTTKLDAERTASARVRAREEEREQELEVLRGHVQELVDRLARQRDELLAAKRTNELAARSADGERARAEEAQRTAGLEAELAALRADRDELERASSRYREALDGVERELKQARKALHAETDTQRALRANVEELTSLLDEIGNASRDAIDALATSTVLRLVRAASPGMLDALERLGAVAKLARKSAERSRRALDAARR